LVLIPFLIINHLPTQLHITNTCRATRYGWTDNIFISNYINIINKDNIFISNIYKNIIYFILFINAIRFLKAKRKGLQIA
jgi:hypothetical protein